MLNRRPTTNWTDKEIKALKSVIALNTPEEDWVILEKRYASGDPYLRRDVLTLLHNWNVEIDRAKAPVHQPTPTVSHTNGRTFQSFPKAKSSVQVNLEHADALINQLESELGINLPPFEQL